jgi:hypothetical protein
VVSQRNQLMEHLRPQPDQSQPRRDAGEGSRGLPVKQREQAPQGEPHKSQERQQLPEVFDVLERMVHLQEERESESQQLGPYLTRVRRAMIVEYNAKKFDLGRELKAVHDLGTDRDRLIIDLYTTMATYESGEPVPWSRGLVLPEHTRQFISHVAPMSYEELDEELRKAQQVVERRTQANRKRRETREANKGLSWAERHKKRLESARRYQQERRKQRKLQAEQQQPTQVFPDHPKK